MNRYNNFILRFIYALGWLRPFRKRYLYPDTWRNRFEEFFEDIHKPMCKNCQWVCKNGSCFKNPCDYDNRYNNFDITYCGDYRYYWFCRPRRKRK